MPNYIIIDSNIEFATKLYFELKGFHKQNAVIDSTNSLSISQICNTVLLEIKDDTIILINAETEIKGKYLQHQPIIEFLYWFRCKYKRKNPIIVYSCISVNHSIKQDSQNIITLSPNCYYFKLPFTKRQIEKIEKFKSFTDDDLKPYLKQAINLEKVRHRYANLSGIALMLKVAISKNSDLKALDIVKSQALNDFLSSLDYHILRTYFNLNFHEFPKKLTSNLSLQSKKILLVDDLAGEGWKALIGQMVYGNPHATEIANVCIKTKKISNKSIVYDEESTIIELENNIREHKPHLILLDLRLNNEEGSKDLNELGGYNLLCHLKKSVAFKGVPVIMFTASRNAETVKQLINAGAEFVWTKPGIDEGLNAEEIVKRYEQLILYVNEVLNPDYTILKLLNDNYDENFKIDQLDIEKIRNLLLKKVEFIKYRLQLFSTYERESLVPEPYKTADAIYIDSNLLVSGEGKYNYAEMVTSVVKLALLTKEFNCNFIAGTQNRTTYLPKVVIMNPVIDEIIKISKTGICEKIMDIVKDKTGNKIEKFNRFKLAYLRATFSQLIIKSLFDSNNIRTELHKDEGKIAISKLENPKENVYADGYILDEIANLILTRKSRIFKYRPNTKVIFISGDQDLILKMNCFRNTKDENNFVTKDENNFVTKDENNFVTKDENNFVTKDESNFVTKDENNFVTKDENNFVTKDENNFVTKDREEIVQDMEKIII